MTAITRVLFDAAVTGPLRQAPGRVILSILAIALGVALGFAIYLINRTAADEVSLAARSLFGLADLSVTSIAGDFDESLYPLVARTPGIAAVSPVVEIDARLVGQRGTIRLLGTDAFRSRQLQPSLAGRMSAAGFAMPGSQQVFLSSVAARELTLRTGDELVVQIGLQPEHFTVAGVLPAGALERRAGVIDIATAQSKFARLGRLTRIDVRFAPGTHPEGVRARLAASLPDGVRLLTPGQASDEALRLSRAYRSNLTALALVALFTGGFLVYSTQSLATLRRRREFAVLHALGVTRREQGVLMLAGGALLGLTGAVVGIVAGIAVANAGLAMLGGDPGAGYFRGVVPILELRSGEMSGFALLGIAVAIIGTLRPALDAARTPTAEALKAGDVALPPVHVHPLLVLAMFVLAAAMLWLPPIAGLPLPGYLSIALLLFAVIAAMPAVVGALGRLPLLDPVPYQIALAYLRGAARHVNLSLSALVVSFSLMVSMAIMVTSFRDSLDLWTQKILPADLYVRAGYVGQTSHLDPASVDALRALPGVARAEVSRFATADVVQGKRSMTLIARSFGDAPVADQLWLERGSDAPSVANTEPVWISEAAADLLGAAPGDQLELRITGRTLRCAVQGIWRDYEHQGGAIVIHRDAYVSLTGDVAVNTVWLWAAADVQVDALRDAVRAALPLGAEYDLRTPRELRSTTLQVFDRTFAVTYLLELVAVLIGLFGISASASAQVLARRREFGVLRHIGLTRAQIGATLAIEGGVLGALGVCVGLLAGGAISLILIYVVNRQSFHWSMDVYVPWQLLTGLSVALIALSAAISVFSGRQAMRGDVVRAVKEDW